MARLRTPVSLATWLAVVLTIFVCTGRSISSENHKRTVKNLFGYRHNVRAEDKTDDDWRKQSEAVLEEIRKKYIKGEVSYSAKEWLGRLTGVPTEFYCSDASTDELIEWRSKSKNFKKFQRIVDDYLELHLRECGFEERLKKALNALKQVSPKDWSSDKYKSLHSYLKSGSWSRIESMELLSVVKDISELDSVSKETDCMYWRMTGALKEQAHKKYGHEFFNGYSKLYSIKCGFEDRFKKAIEALKQVSPNDWSSDEYKTLHGYLRKNFYPRDSTKGGRYSGDMEREANQLLPVVEDISKLLFDSSEDIDCSDDYMTTVLTRRMSETSESFHKLIKFLDAYGELYSAKCGFDERFKRAIVHVERVSNKRFGLATKNPTLYRYFTEYRWDQDKAARLLGAIRELSDPNSISGTIDCSEKHKAQVSGWFIKSWYYHKLHKFLGGYYEFYFKQCGFEELFQKAIENAKKFPHRHWEPSDCPSLSSCLLSETFDANSAAPLVSLIEEISNLDDTSAKLDCTDEHETMILQLYVKNRFHLHSALNNLVRDYFEFYLGKCGFDKQFRAVIDNIKRFSPKADLGSYETMCSSLKPQREDIEEIKLPLSIIRWLSKLGDISQETDCSNKLETDLLVVLDRSKPYPVVANLAEAYFARFLDKCGHEERFKKAFDNMKHSDYQSTIPTLGTYFSEHRYLNQSARLWVLSVVKELSALENFSSETHCNDKLLTKLLKWNARNDEIGYYKILLRDYFAFYLSECGFEQIFQKLSDNKTLFNLLWDKRWRESWSEQVMSTVEELNYLQNISKQPNCPRELIDNLLELHAKSKKDNPELYKLVEATLTRLEDKCGSIRPQ